MEAFYKCSRTSCFGHTSDFMRKNTDRFSDGVLSLRKVLKDILDIDYSFPKGSK